MLPDNIFMDARQLPEVDNIEIEPTWLKNIAKEKINLNTSISTNWPQTTHQKDECDELYKDSETNGCYKIKVGYLQGIINHNFLSVVDDLQNAF